MASALMISAQKGHLFISPEASSTFSIALVFFLETRTKRNPITGDKTREIKNAAQNEFPRL
jgi:hypothetical protein